MGILDAILSGLGTVGNVLDTPRAMAWEGLRGRNPFAVANPFDEEAVANRPTGWDLLKALGIEGEEGFDWTDIPAVALEAIGDPTNLLGGGMLAKAMGKTKKVKKVAKEAVASNVKREKLLGIGAMPEEIAEKTVLRTAPEAATPEAKALISRHLNRFAAGEPMTNAEFVEAPKFREALEKTIVVDPERRGPPAMGYHGTTADFPEFNDTKDLGYHFGNVMQAQDRILGMQEQFPTGSNIRQHYLDARNPLNVPDVFGSSPPYRLRDAMSDVAGRQIGGKVPLWEDLRDWMQKRGHDAVTYANEVEGPGLSVAVLDPSQIYAPYIAPRAREVPRVPNTFLEQALLGGYNALRPAHR